jgi:hypothetical protein
MLERWVEFKEGYSVSDYGRVRTNSSGSNTVVLKKCWGFLKITLTIVVFVLLLILAITKGAILILIENIKNKLEVL